MTGAVAVLGATGSIGLQALEVADALGWEVTSLAAGTPSSRLASLAARHPGAAIAIASEPDPGFSETVGRPVGWGPGAVADIASRPGQVVVNGIVGSAGLGPTMAALEAGNRLALANKESLVAAGPLVIGARDSHGAELIPVDSEHSAIFQCLGGESPDSIRRLILTASGGPFRGLGREDLRAMRPEDALAHPTWDMGPRITIDSATLVNKGLEVIEAHHLFGVPFDQIDVVVHPQSIAHSAVEFVDGSIKAQLGRPDMRHPIQYALTHPERSGAIADRLELAGATLGFELPDHEAFPALGIAYEAGRAGGTSPAVLNAADEIAVDAFLNGSIGFLDIPSVLEEALEGVEWTPLESLEDVARADASARRAAWEVVARKG